MDLLQCNKFASLSVFAFEHLCCLSVHLLNDVSFLLWHMFPLPASPAAGTNWGVSDPLDELLVSRRRLVLGQRL